MEEQLISFETAKLAKEKGFKLPLHSNRNYYNLNGNIHPYNWFNQFELADYTDAPTQSLLQKWLREVHKINIFISSKTIENKTIFIPHGRTIPDTIKNNLIVDIIQYCTNNTYEEALEIALFEALKLI